MPRIQPTAADIALVNDSAPIEPIVRDAWFIVDTQVMEDYGYCWKAKGGHTYYVHAPSEEWAEHLWQCWFKAKYNGPCNFTETIIGISEGKGDPHAMSADESKQCELTPDHKPYKRHNREMLKDKMIP